MVTVKKNNELANNTPVSPKRIAEVGALPKAPRERMDWPYGGVVSFAKPGKVAPRRERSTDNDVNEG